MRVRLNGNDLYIASSQSSNDNATYIDKFIKDIKQKDLASQDDKGILQFINDWKHDGFWVAMYDKPFFQVTKDFFSQLGHDIGIFILENSELIFVMPIVVFMIGTWIAGRNKYTKWIIPLGIAYLFSKFFYYMMEG